MNSDDTVDGVSESTQWARIGGTWLRILRFAPASAPNRAPGRVPPGAGGGVRVPAPGLPQQGMALLVPGLGLPRYLLPLARLQGAHGLETLVLDALAWRGRGRRAEPTITGLAEAAAAWLTRCEVHPLVVVGHSTGAQVALETVLRIQRTRGDLALVMAGPTFQPDQRSLAGLVPAAMTAYRKDTPRELVVVKDIARVRTDLVRIVQSARRHRVEDRVGGLQVPLTVTAGEADSLATPAWLDLLAGRAGGSGRAVVLPGSHNNVFTHPAQVGALVFEALGTTRGAGPQVSGA